MQTHFTTWWRHSAIFLSKMLTNTCGMSTYIAQSIKNNKSHAYVKQPITFPKTSSWIHAVYPHFSKASLGYHVPLFEGSNPNNVEIVVGAMGPSAC